MFQNIEILLLSEVKAKRLTLHLAIDCIKNPSDHCIFKGKQHKSYPDHCRSHFWNVAVLLPQTLPATHYF